MRTSAWTAGSRTTPRGPTTSPFGFKLRLDQRQEDGIGNGRRAPGPEHLGEGRKDFENRNEGDVHDRKVRRRGKIIRPEVPGVFFEENDARIAAQAVVDLADRDVDGENPDRAALKKAIRESARGGADVGAGAAFGRNAERVQRFGQLQSAPADKRQRRCDAQRRVRREKGTRFFDPPAGRFRPARP